MLFSSLSRSIFNCSAYIIETTLATNWRHWGIAYSLLVTEIGYEILMGFETDRNFRLTPFYYYLHFTAPTVVFSVDFPPSLPFTAYDLLFLGLVMVMRRNYAVSYPLELDHSSSCWTVHEILPWHPDAIPNAAFTRSGCSAIPSSYSPSARLAAGLDDVVYQHLNGNFPIVRYSIVIKSPALASPGYSGLYRWARLAVELGKPPRT